LPEVAPKVSTVGHAGVTVRLRERCHGCWRLLARAAAVASLAVAAALAPSVLQLQLLQMLLSAKTSDILA